MEIEQFILLIPTVLRNCSAIQDDLNKLGEWAVIFIEPLTFLETVTKNVARHPLKVKKDVEHIIDDYNKKLYFEFGTDIGVLFVFITSKAASETAEEITADVQVITL